MKVLIVEDEVKTGDYLRQGLGEAGYNTDLARTGIDGLHLALTGGYDLLILDVMLPGLDGWQILETVRRGGTDMPVLFLTARDQVEDRVKGLELGADDYLPKPFNPRELLARIKAILRRATSEEPIAGALSGRRVAFADWQLDTDRRVLIGKDGAETALTTAEFRLLTVLLERPRLVLSREQLLDLTSGRAAQAFDRAIDNQISRLRRKIEADPGRPAIITTVRSGGYCLATDVRDLP